MVQSPSLWATLKGSAGARHGRGRTDPRRTRLHLAVFFVQRAEQAQLQCDYDGGSWRSVLERGFRYLGVRISSYGHLLCLPGIEILPFIGVGWLLHTGWDALHHLYGNPIVPFAADSSLGCAICDPVIAPWCFAGAPSVYDFLRKRNREGQRPVP